MTEPTALICTGGMASRLGDLAPGGCKALTELGGRPIIEWQLDVLGSATIICRPDHEVMLERYGPCVTGVWSGVGASIADALHVVPDGPVTVVYGDTLFNEIPEGSDWVGVSDAPGGRNWDVVHHGPMVEQHYVSYEYVPPEITRKVCVGLYSLADIHKARRIFDFFAGMNAIGGTSWGMGPILNHYRSFGLLEIPSWMDVGDPEALSRASEARSSTMETRTVLRGGEMASEPGNQKVV